MRLVKYLIFVGFLSLSVNPAWAEEPKVEEPKVEEAKVEESVSESAKIIPVLTLGGRYRLSGISVSEVRVFNDSDPAAPAAEKIEPFGNDHRLMQQIHWAPKLTYGKTLSLNFDIQLSAGYLSVAGPDERYQDVGRPVGEDGMAFGDSTDMLDQLQVRKAYLDWRSPVGVLRFGRMSSSWGTGILANGGDEEPEWGSTQFTEGRAVGDIVNRLMFATAPLAFATKADWARKVLVVAGMDMVEWDERTNASKGDSVFQGVFALRYKHDDKNEAGIYMALRNGEDRWGDELKVTAYDFFAKGCHKVGDIRLYGIGEFVMVQGTTTMVRSYSSPDGVDVIQAGGVARLGATYLPLQLGAELESGYASGDDNPNDDGLRAFRFDPNYKPSLILFGELLSAQTVAATVNAGNPELVAQAPTSVRHLPTDGSVTNAMYFKPTVRYQAGDFRAKASLLWARAAADIVDPYISKTAPGAGGAARNFLGGDGSERDLGVEINVGVDYKWRHANIIELRPSLQFGHFMPGPAFTDADGTAHPAITAFYAALSMSWLPEAVAKTNR